MPAGRVAYQTIDISSCNTQLKNLISTIQLLEHLGERVNQINFNAIIRNSENPWDDERDYFEKLADYCPYVKVITSERYCYWLWI